jgi:hypothetical protein
MTDINLYYTERLSYSTENTLFSLESKSDGHKEITTVYCKNHMKRINTPLKQGT